LWINGQTPCFIRVFWQFSLVENVGIKKDNLWKRTDRPLMHVFRSVT